MGVDYSSCYKATEKTGDMLVHRGTTDPTKVSVSRGAPLFVVLIVLTVSSVGIVGFLVYKGRRRVNHDVLPRFHAPSEQDIKMKLKEVDSSSSFDLPEKPPPSYQRLGSAPSRILCVVTPVGPLDNTQSSSVSGPRALDRPTITKQHPSDTSASILPPLPTLKSWSDYVMKRRAHLRLSTQTIDSFETGSPTSDRFQSPTSLSFHPPHQDAKPAIDAPSNAITRHQPSPYSRMPFLPEPIDYFNFKQRTYLGPSPLPSSKPPRYPGSHFSPTITPAAPEVLTRPSSPPLQSGFTHTLFPTPEDEPFPYLSYESSVKSGDLLPTPAHIPLPASPYPQETVNIKVYFHHADELIKFRVSRGLLLADFIGTAAQRMPSGWESLYCTPAGVDVQDIPSMDLRKLKRLSQEQDWQAWLDRSLASASRRLVLWAK
ncbi:hypothetical protein FRB99_002453 [Tulasnella sp. 403]|nr:hypothetical protein FRB99_002453 [Tulasnella sp. 403]